MPRVRTIPDKPIPHGTTGGYDNYKCRCPLCSEVKSNSGRIYYEENRLTILASNAVNERRSAARKLRRQDRRDRVNQIKVGEGCADCGYNTHPAALDFDHVRGIKLGSVAELVNSDCPWVKVEEEISKCDVVCSNCHRIRTFERLRKEIA